MFTDSPVPPLALCALGPPNKYQALDFLPARECTPKAHVSPIHSAALSQTKRAPDFEWQIIAWLYNSSPSYLFIFFLNS